MSSIAKSFTAVGDGFELLAPAGVTVGYAVTGTFVGTVLLEVLTRAGWATVTSVTAVSRGSFPSEAQGRTTRYRFRCSAYTSGTIVTALDWAPATAASGLAPVHQATRELTDAEVKALNATPITVAPAVGLNRLCIPVAGVMRRVFRSAYTNVNGAATIYLADSLAGTTVLSNSVDADFLIATSAAIATFNPANLYEATRAALENAGIAVMSTNSAGAYTGGHADNRLVVSVSYLVLNLETGRYE
jgi:hypothetical protein